MTWVSSSPDLIGYGDSRVQAYVNPGPSILMVSLYGRVVYSVERWGERGQETFFNIVF